MKHVPVHELKAHCSALLASVANKNEPIVITKHGRPLAKIVPILPDKNEHSDEKPLKNSVLYYGDIESPIGEDWEVIK